MYLHIVKEARSFKSPNRSDIGHNSPTKQHFIRIQNTLGAEKDYHRPSSSGGRLEQHLGAVESVDVPSLAAIVEPTAVPRGGCFSSGSPPIPATIAAARGAGGTAERPGRGVGGRINGGHVDINTSELRGGGGGGGTGFGSSKARGLEEQPPAKKMSDTRQHGNGRRARDGKDSGRRRASEFVSGPAAAAESSPSKGGMGRPKVDGVRSRPRRVLSQISFGSTITESSGASVCSVDRGEEAGEQGGERPEKGTEDNKFRMQAGQSNTLVAVRLRPLLKLDREQVQVAKVILLAYNFLRVCVS